MIKAYIKVFASARVPLTAVYQYFLRWNAVNVFPQSAAGPYFDWDDLSEPYGSRKEAVIGFEYPELQYDRVLAYSMTHADAPGSIGEIYDDKLIMGTEVTNANGFPYPIALNDGGKNLPARKFLRDEEADMERYAKIFFESAKRRLAAIRKPQ